MSNVKVVTVEQRESESRFEAETSTFSVHQLSFLETAELNYQEIVLKLQHAGSDVENAAQTFDRLVELLRRLEKWGEEMKAVTHQSSSEIEQFTARFEEYRRRVIQILKQFPADLTPRSRKPGDALPELDAANTGVWNLLQTLAKNESENRFWKVALTDLQKEAEKESRRLEKIKKTLADAEALLKGILDEKKPSDTIIDRLNQLRQLVEKERRDRQKLIVQQDVSKLVVEKLKNEFADVAKVSHQLFQKCAEIQRSMAEIGVVLGEQSPAYRPDSDPREQFDIALSWLIKATDQLVEMLHNSKKRLEEVENQKNKLDEQSQKSNDKLKKATTELAYLGSKVKDAETRLRNEKCAADQWKAINEELRSAYERSVKMLKVFCSDETKFTKEVTVLLTSLTNECIASLERMKAQLPARAEGSDMLAKQVDRLLEELRKLKRQYDDENARQRDWHKRLQRQEEELSPRLKDARDRLKSADEKRRSMAEKVRNVKKQLDNTLDSEHDMEAQLNGFNKQHVTAQAEIARMTLENAQLKEKATKGDFTIGVRQQVLDDFSERQANAEAAIKKLEKENNKLKWKGETKGAGHQCPYEGTTDNPQQEVDTLRGTITDMKKEMEELHRRVEHSEAELERMKQRSTSSAESAGSPSPPPKQMQEVRRRSTSRGSRGRFVSRGWRSRSSSRDIVAAADRGGQLAESWMAAPVQIDEGDGRTITVNADVNIRVTELYSEDNSEQQ